MWRSWCRSPRGSSRSTRSSRTPARTRSRRRRTRSHRPTCSGWTTRSATTSCSCRQGTHTFHFRVRAATEGSFVHPAPYAELMYREEVRGRGEGLRVVVKGARMSTQAATATDVPSAARAAAPVEAGRRRCSRRCWSAPGGAVRPRAWTTRCDSVGALAGSSSTAGGTTSARCPARRRRARLLAAALRAARTDRRGHARDRRPALLRARRRLPASVARAVLQNVRNGRVISGASTIAMQVARMQTREAAPCSRKPREAAGGAAAHPRHGHDAGAAPVPHARAVREPRARRGPRRAALLRQAGRGSLLGSGRLPRGAAADAGAHEPLHARRAAARAQARHRILRRCTRAGFLTTMSSRRRSRRTWAWCARPHRQPEAMHAVLEWSAQAKRRQTADLSGDARSRDPGAVASHPPRQPAAHARSSGAGNTAALVVDTATGDILA